MITNDKKRIIILSLIGLLGLCGTFFIQFLTDSNGVGVSPDSVAYISVARNLSNGEGFITYDGYPFLLQPPLYPILLSVTNTIFSVDPLHSAGLLNSILFGLIIIGTGFFLLKHLKSLALSLFGTIVVLVSYILMQSALLALSEMLFIFFLIMYLNLFDRYEQKADLTSLILFSISVSLAFLTRYTGIVLILTGALGILFWGNSSMKEKYQHLFIFLLITVTPTGIWIFRNLILSGTFVGERGVSSFTFETNLRLLFDVMLKWFYKVQIDTIQVIPLMSVITIVIFIGVIYLIRLKRTDYPKYLLKAVPIFLFALFYIMLIVISSTTTAYDKISTRLLSPVFIPVVILLFMGFDQFNTRLKSGLKHIFISTIFFISIGYWIHHQVTHTAYIVTDFISRSGEEYSSDIWKNNSIINFLNNHNEIKNSYSFYSNAPEAVYILTNLETKWSPQKTVYNSTLPIINDAMLKNLWYDKNEICLIWFNSINRKFLFTIDELHKSAVLKKIIQLKDGDIYIVSNPLSNL